MKSFFFFMKKESNDESENYNVREIEKQSKKGGLVGS